MNSHSKQVRPLTIWGRRETGLELYPSPHARKEGGQEAPGGGACGQRDSWTAGDPPDTATPRPLPESPSFLGAFTYSGGFFLVAWPVGSGHLGTGPETRRTGQGRGRRRWPGQRKGWPSCRSPGPQERKPVHSETLWGGWELGGARRSPEEAPALEPPSFGLPSGYRRPHPQGMSLGLLGPGFPRRSPLSHTHGAPLPPPMHAPSSAHTPIHLSGSLPPSPVSDGSSGRLSRPWRPASFPPSLTTASSSGTQPGRQEGACVHCQLLAEPQLLIDPAAARRLLLQPREAEGARQQARRAAAQMLMGRVENPHQGQQC